MSFAHRLQEMLAERKMSQVALAKASGVGQTTISSWMTTGSDPRWDHVCAVARALGVSTETFRPEGERVEAGRRFLLRVTIGPAGGREKDYQEIGRVPVVCPTG